MQLTALQFVQPQFARVDAGVSQCLAKLADGIVQGLNVIQHPVDGVGLWVGQIGRGAVSVKTELAGDFSTHVGAWFTGFDHSGTVQRELEVLRLFKTELSGPEIAQQLVVGLSTVRTHTKRIYSKLNVNSRRAAVNRAAELNLL